MTEIITKSEQETKKMAGLLAEEIAKKPLKIKGAVVIGLQGELGSGKTNFVQGFARGLGIRKRLTSPTFVLLKRYRVNSSRFAVHSLYHVDCYRLNKAEDLLDLDFNEIITNPENVVLIEWAEKVRKILPKDTIWISFKVVSGKKRKITINSKFT